MEKVNSIFTVVLLQGYYIFVILACPVGATLSEVGTTHRGRFVPRFRDSHRESLLRRIADPDEQI